MWPRWAGFAGKSNGTAPALVDSGLGSSGCGCGLVDCLVFDGCEAAERSLPTAPVVGALDPGDDGQAQVLPCGPALTVQDVLLEQGEERFHGRVIAARADAAH